MKKVIDFIIDHLWLRALIGAIIGGITAGQMDDGNWMIGSLFGAVISIVLPLIIIIGGADFGRFRKK